jgi:hypothetical protein
MTKLYGFWAKDGDTAAIQTYLKVYAPSTRVRSDVEILRRRAKAAAGRAFLALARRDTASALRQFRTMKDTVDECWYDNRIGFVQVLIAAKRYEEAATQLERRWPGTSGCDDGFSDVMWTLDRARVFDRLGRRREAAANYAFVADAWKSADSELQIYVLESHAALARLRGGQSIGP